jgi:glycosyltransferase involved in cell wall biosynthesis
VLEILPTPIGIDARASLVRDRPARPGSVLIIVPAFNEAASVRLVVRELVARGYETIVVDDGSTDATAEAAEAGGAIVLRHRLNRGQGAALQTGIEFARMRGAAAVVTFDADGQHDVADVEALVAPILAGECDVVLGSRFLGSTEGMPWSRRLVLRLGVLFTRLTSGLAITDTHNGLRALSACATREIELTLDRMAHASEILDQIRLRRLRWRELPVHVRYTAESLRKGQSSWSAARIAAIVVWRRLTS